MLFKKISKGVNYEIPDELLGFLGFRKVPLHIVKNLNFKIAEFQEQKEMKLKKYLKV